MESRLLRAYDCVLALPLTFVDLILGRAAGRLLLKSQVQCCWQS